MEQAPSSRNRALGVALFALGLAATLLLPAFANDYIVGVGVSAFTFTAAAICLNLVYGYAGLLSFAQLAFWGIGGYCTALLVMDAGASFGTGLIAAALLNAVLALVVGWPALRLQRDSFVIVTLSFALLAFLISRDWVDLTRGPLGLRVYPCQSCSESGSDRPSRCTTSPWVGPSVSWRSFTRWSVRGSVERYSRSSTTCPLRLRRAFRPPPIGFSPSHLAQRLPA